MSRVWRQVDGGEIVGLLSVYVLLIISFDVELDMTVVLTIIIS